MENTSGNKEKLFAQYYGCPYIQDNGIKGRISGAAFIRESAKGKSRLELNPISSITDEHAIEVGIITGIWTRNEIKEIESTGDSINDQLIKFGNIFCDGIGKQWGLRLSCPFAGGLQDIIEAIGYLYSKGYVFDDFFGTVEEKVNNGWVVLKTKDNE